MKCRARDFGRIENTFFDHIAELVFKSVVTEVCFLCAQHVIYDNAAVNARVFRDLFNGGGKGFRDDERARFFVAAESICVCGNFVADGQKGNAAAGDDTFFDSRAGCRKSVFDAEFSFFHFDFGCRADSDDCYAARKFCKAFLKFFFVVVAGAFRNLVLDCRNALFDERGIACAVNDGGVVFVDLNHFRAAQHIEGCVLDFVAEIGRNDGCACQDCDIFKHCFASVTVTGGFDRNALDCAFEFVQDKGGKSLAFDFFCDDEQAAA